MHDVVDEQTLTAKVGSDEAPALRSNHAMVVGLGNIGSQVVPLLAPKIDSIRLVDRDVVEAHNVENQCYARGDIGRKKVDIFAERLRDAHPHLQVDRFVGELQDMPWGEFADVDVVLAGLDSLSARQSLAEILYPLQVPYIDGAVGDPFDVRVQVLLPGSACLECSWGKGQYRQLHTETPCRPGAATDTPRTLAPAAAGAGARRHRAR